MAKDQQAQDSRTYVRKLLRQEQIDLHVKADAAATLHLVEVDDPSRFGVVPTDGTGRVMAFLEKTPNPRD